MKKYLQIISSQLLLCFALQGMGGDIHLTFESFPVIPKSIKGKDVVRTINIPNLFIHDGQKSQLIQIEENKPLQTFDIKIKQEYVVLKHRVSVYDNYEFLFQNGDSIVIRYDPNGTPQIEVSNRNVLEGDYLYESLINPLNKDKLGLECNQCFMNTPFLKSKSSKISQLPHEFISELRHESKACFIELTASNRVLDSLVISNRISPQWSAYYYARNEFKKKRLELVMEIISKKEAENLIASSRSLPNYIEHLRYSFLRDYTDKFIVAELPQLGSKFNFYYDYRIAFDTISNSNVFSREDKNIHLLQQLYNISGKYPVTDFNTYYTKYIESATDSVLIQKFRNSLDVMFNKNVLATNGLILTDAENNETNLGEIIKKNKGKVIYIDFWASWCGPCREAMPASNILRKELRDMPVIFVYLSSDSNVNAWKKASEKEDISNHHHNYLIMNNKNSDFIKKYNIQTIPRYMIIDKKGDLIYPEAPRVEDPATAELLKNLAAK